ncbi:MAG: hypothetical protein ABSG37_10485 [Candidatus Limnocylindrales bacterium]
MSPRRNDMDVDDLDDVDPNASGGVTLLQIRVSGLEEQQRTATFYRAAEELSRIYRQNTAGAECPPPARWADCDITVEVRRTA